MKKRNKTLDGIPMCWLDCKGIIQWGVVVKVEGPKQARRVRFNDDGWNPAMDCFLTEDQCLRYNNRPPVNCKGCLQSTVERLNSVVENLKDKQRSTDE